MVVSENVDPASSRIKRVPIKSSICRCNPHLFRTVNNKLRHLLDCFFDALLEGLLYLSPCLCLLIHPIFVAIRSDEFVFEKIIYALPRDCSLGRIGLVFNLDTLPQFWWMKLPLHC